MRLQPLLCLVGMLAALLPLAACGVPPEFTNEPAAEAVPYDGRLLGGWYSTPKGTDHREPYTYVLQIASAGPRTISVVATWTGKLGLESSEEEQAWLKATGHAIRVGSDVYYSFQRENGIGSDYTGVGERPGYVILRAEILKDDTLILHFMNAHFVIHPLIESGRLHGRDVTCVQPCATDGNSSAAYTLVDDSPDEIAWLLQAIPPELLFGDSFGPFHRYGGPSPSTQ